MFHVKHGLPDLYDLPAYWRNDVNNLFTAVEGLPDDTATVIIKARAVAVADCAGQLEEVLESLRSPASR
jgi:hypothetical protein